MSWQGILWWCGVPMVTPFVGLITEEQLHYLFILCVCVQKVTNMLTELLIFLSWSALEGSSLSESISVPTLMSKKTKIVHVSFFSGCRVCPWESEYD